MKKLTFVISSFFLVCVSLYADKKISFTVTPDFGVVNGQINEFVYYVPDIEESNTHSNEIRKLSELNWDVYWVPYLGTNFTIDIDTGMYFDFGFKFGMPRASYAMVDRDWVNCEKFPDQNWLTNYSIHQNYLDFYYDLDFAIGQKFNLIPGIEIKTELFGSNNNFAFSAEKGWGLYGENWRPRQRNNEILVGPAESGEDITWKSVVISYKQNRVFAGLGLEVEKTFNFGLALCLFGKVRFAYVQAEDYHYNTTTDYLDKPYGFGGILAGGNVSYRFNEKHKISLKGTYDWLPLILGPDYANEYGDFWSTDSQYLGGASSTLYSVSLSYTFTF